MADVWAAAVKILVDLRINHCDIDFMCRTAVTFETWDAEKQKRFIDFIAGKKIDNLDFSLGIDKGSLLDEFEALELK